jgi:hypothetical protein
LIKVMSLQASMPSFLAFTYSSICSVRLLRKSSHFTDAACNFFLV